MRFHLLLFCLVLPPTSSFAQDKRPNILFFLVDDMGWQDTSVPFHTQRTPLNDDYRTPNMEKLAAKSLLFTSAYACAICSPSRVSLMTGRNAARHGVTCWTLQKDVSPEPASDKRLLSSDWTLNGLQPETTAIPRGYAAVTLPRRLAAAGYRTIHVGKAHFGAKDTPGAEPKNFGFETNIAGSYMGGPGSYSGLHDFSGAWRGAGHIWDIPGLEKYHGKDINLTEALTREAIAEMDRSVAAKKPFYLYMAHYAVHAPYEPDTRFLPGYAAKKWPERKKTYASMIESMDKSLGDFLAEIDRLGIADNTIVVFMSDNGSPRENQANLPLRGYKTSPYEGGDRVPLMVYDPGRTRPGRTQTPVIIEDIYPTFLEMAGVEIPGDIDGRSFVDILNRPQTDRSARPLFWHYPNFYAERPFSSVRLGDMKLIYRHDPRGFELYDLHNDLGEKNNLAKKDPVTVKRLAKVLGDHLRACGAKMPKDRQTGKPLPLPDEIQL